jgi:hypothetical protein
MTVRSQAHLSLLLHERLSAFEIDELRRYSDTLELLLRNERSRFERRLDGLAAGLPDAERDEYLAQYSDEYHELKDAFPDRLREGLLISSYSTLESRLVAISRSLLKLDDADRDMRDLPGKSPLMRARGCIRDIARIPLSNDAWTNLEPYRLVRNVVVHGSGQFRGSPPAAVESLARRASGLSIDSARSVQLGPDFASTFLSEMERFYAALFSAWRTASAV